MTECQHCSRKCQLFLCSQCIHDLKDMLAGLAGRTATNMLTGETRQDIGWLELLEDSALGRTRLGESERRSTEQNSPMPVNLGASQLLQNVRNTLATWIRHICETRGVKLP